MERIWSRARMLPVSVMMRSALSRRTIVSCVAFDDRWWCYWIFYLTLRFVVMACGSDSILHISLTLSLSLNLLYFFFIPSFNQLVMPVLLETKLKQRGAHYQKAD